MNKNSLWQILVVGIAIFSAGCGALEVVENSARDAIVESIDETIAELVGGLVDLESLRLPLDNDEEGQSEGDGVLTQEERTAYDRELEFREIEDAKKELQAAIDTADEGSERLVELKARLKRIEDREAERRAEQESASGEER